MANTNTCTTSKIKMPKSYEAFFNFFIADDAKRLVLLPKGMSGTDAAVLCHVADGLCNEAGITCVQVDDNPDATTSVIDEFVQNLGESFDPSQNYVSILVFDVNNVNYMHIAELSTDAHRILTTFVPCDCADDDYDGADRVVILPNGTVAKCTIVQYWSTAGSALREIGKYLTAFIKNYDIRDDIAHAVKKFIKTHKRDDNDRGEMRPNFARSGYYETSILDDMETMRNTPLRVMLKSSVIHSLFYNWCENNGQLDKYITTMAGRILNGELYTDPKFAKYFRYSLDSRDNDIEFAEFKSQLSNLEPSEFDEYLENALQFEFGSFAQGYLDIVDSMVCVSTGNHTYADVVGLKLQLNAPSVVVYDGDPTTPVPYEDAIIEYITNHVRAINPTASKTEKSSYLLSKTMSKRVIPLRTARGKLVTAGGTRLISLVIKHHPGDRDIIKVWVFEPATGTLVNGIIRDSLWMALSKAGTSEVTDIDGNHLYMLSNYTGTVIDLENQ